MRKYNLVLESISIYCEFLDESSHIHFIKKKDRNVHT